MIVAERIGRFDTIGIDCVAMNVNDLICVGAEPIAMVDFILCAEADPEVCGAIGVGLRARRRAGRDRDPRRRDRPGRETSSAASSSPAARSASSTSTRSSPASGSSPATRSSACRRPACTPTATRSRAGRSPTLELDDDRLGRPLGEVLLEPTEIYVRPVLELLASPVDVRGLAHITGDGLNNLMRLAAPVGYEIDDPLGSRRLRPDRRARRGLRRRDARGLQHGLWLRLRGRRR